MNYGAPSGGAASRSRSARKSLRQRARAAAPRCTWGNDAVATEAPSGRPFGAAFRILSALLEGVHGGDVPRCRVTDACHQKLAEEGLDDAGAWTQIKGGYLRAPWPSTIPLAASEVAPLVPVDRTVVVAMLAFDASVSHLAGSCRVYVQRRRALEVVDAAFTSGGPVAPRDRLGDGLRVRVVCASAGGGAGGAIGAGALRAGHRAPSQGHGLWHRAGPGLRRRRRGRRAGRRGRAPVLRPVRPRGAGRRPALGAGGGGFARGRDRLEAGPRVPPGRLRNSGRGL